VEGKVRGMKREVWGAISERERDVLERRVNRFSWELLNVGYV
jgi:hypothetical protein